LEVRLPVVRRVLVGVAGRFFIALSCLAVANQGWSQTNAKGTSPSAGTGLTEEQVELQRKLGTATAAARKDPQVEAAFQKAIKALRESDELMYKKIKQIDPSLTEIVDQILQAKYPDLAPRK
jgi:hypothetical protein